MKIRTLTNRLRGQYEVGPHLPNGDPEFGWNQFEAPPIQHEAAAEIERLRGIILINGKRAGASDDEIARLLYPEDRDGD